MQWTALDFWIVVVGALSAAACAIPGCFLVLRRLSMMGDAISHAVLPGLAAAFLIMGSRDSLPMFVGAVITGVLTAFLVETVRRHGRVDEGAAMGVVFTSLFALGLILIRQAADKVDLDPGCVLYGALESTVMASVVETARVQGLIAGGGTGTWEALMLCAGAVPRAAWVNGTVLVLNIGFVAVFWKELKLAAFDPALAQAMGFRPGVMHHGLMAMTAVTTVAAFETVGSILVIAMLVAPAATACLLARRLGRVLVLSVAIAVACAVLGHWGAVAIPARLGLPDTSTAGMMATCAGVLFGLAWVLSPGQGLLAGAAARGTLWMQITRDDVLAHLYRAEELDGAGGPRSSAAATASSLHQSPLAVGLALRWLRAGGRLEGPRGAMTLTRRGERDARKLVRRHRLWESYLVREMGVREDHVHGSAERLEHLADPAVAARLESEAGAVDVDPHQRPIPRE